MTRAQIVDHYLKVCHEPDFQIDEVRKKLESAEVPEEEIRTIVRLIDNEMQRKLHTKHSQSSSSQMVYIGLVVAGVGALITIGTYTGLINSGRHFVIAYGPFLTGISIMLAGMAKKR